MIHLCWFSKKKCEKNKQKQKKTKWQHPTLCPLVFCCLLVLSKFLFFEPKSSKNLEKPKKQKNKLRCFLFLFGFLKVLCDLWSTTKKIEKTKKNPQTMWGQGVAIGPTVSRVLLFSVFFWFSRGFCYFWSNPPAKKDLEKTKQKNNSTDYVGPRGSHRATVSRLVVFLFFGFARFLLFAVKNQRNVEKTKKKQKKQNPTDCVGPRCSHRAIVSRVLFLYWFSLLVKTHPKKKNPKKNTLHRVIPTKTFQNNHDRFYVSLIVSGEDWHTIHLLKCVRLLSTSQTDWRQSSDILSDISFDSLSDIPSDISSDIKSDLLSDISPDILSGILSDISSNIVWHFFGHFFCNMSGILSGILSDILSRILSDIFWHSVRQISWHIFRHSFWHLLWQPFWHFFWHISWHSVWHSFWHSFRHISWHSVWHIVWQSFWHCLTNLLLFCLSYLLTFFLAYLLTFCVTFFLTFLLTYLLTFCATFFLTFCLTFFLTYCLIVFLTFFLTYLLKLYLEVEVRHGQLNSQDRSEVRHGTLSSHDRGWRRGGRGREGGEREEGEGEEGGGEAPDIKSNNPHLTGGEQKKKLHRLCGAKG